MQSVLQLITAVPRRHDELRNFGLDVTLRLMYGSYSSIGASHGPGNVQMGYEDDRQVRNDVKAALMALDYIRE
jgi:hypothetical protein